MPERDALTSLHRYTRLTLLATVPIIGLAPLLVSVGNGPHWARLAPLVIGTVVLLRVHWRRVTRAVDAPDEVAPWRPSAVTLAVATALFCYAYAYGDPGNVMWIFLPAAPVAELQFGRPPSAGWRLTAWLAAGAGVL
ncbi:MAG: hypothetical protein M3422_08320, partial [Actinomycetota bacterium]|nr:hypothetical protein [Actinomycetota bacterium]